MQIPKISRLVRVSVVVAMLVVGAGLWFALPRTNHVPSSIEAPSLTHEQFYEVSDTLATMLRQNGSVAVFNYVADQVVHNPSFARDCHPLMHMLGHEAFQYYGDAAAALEHQNELCNSGYTHGVIERGLTNVTDINQAVQTVCNTEDAGITATQQEDFKRWQCFHGVGHGVMAYTDRQVDRSLPVCEQLPTTFAVESCANGVFMEHFIAVSHTGRPRQNPDIGFSTCQATADAYKYDCYYYQPTAYLGLYEDTYKTAYEHCQAAPEPAYSLTCIAGVGGQAMKDHITAPRYAHDFCVSLSAYADQEACVRGAIGIYINHTASSAAAEPLCSQEFKDFQAACLWEVTNRRQKYGI